MFCCFSAEISDEIDGMKKVRVASLDLGSGPSDTMMNRSRFL